jgi:hypothetical protein
VKAHNQYVETLDAGLYADVPKAVWAAIALSFAARVSGDDPGFDGALRAALQEWELLYANGLVPQSVPARLLKGIL